MNSSRQYKVPDVLDVIYQDIISGLYFSQRDNSVKCRIKIAKCNLACDMLISTNLTEEEITIKLEFIEIELFREIFKDFLGITPKEFRKRFHKL